MIDLLHALGFAAGDAGWTSGAARFLAEFSGFFVEMAPYLLFGFLAAGLLSVLVSPQTVERHLGGHGFWPVLKAALFGIPLPLCSCSVLPVTASLRRHGAGRGAAVAFLISAPETGVDSILATFSLLGPVWAVFKPLAALASGLAGGALVDVLEPHGEADTQAVAPCEDACCGEEAAAGRNRFARIIAHGFIELPRDIGRPLLIGMLIAGAIAVFVPQTVLETVGTGFGGIVFLMLLGIPMYVCATASIPVAAALVMKGASPGAALAFLMTGPATNAAGIATVWKMMGARTALVYLGSIAFTALGAGLLFDLLVKEMKIPPLSPPHEMLPDEVKIASAVLLVLVLGYALLRPARDASHARAESDDAHSHAGHDHEAGVRPCDDENDPAAPCCQPDEPHDRPPRGPQARA